MQRLIETLPPLEDSFFMLKQKKNLQNEVTTHTINAGEGNF